MIDGVTNPVHAAAQTVTRGETPCDRQACPAEHPSEKADAVELSPTARKQLGRDEPAPVRAQLVERIRAEVAAGTYLTDAKLDAAVTRLRAEIFNAA
jgi:anti-sigma28 factor (negative regulator of flagellin synthesis)